MAIFLRVGSSSRSLGTANFLAANSLATAPQGRAALLRIDRERVVDVESFPLSALERLSQGRESMATPDLHGAKPAPLLAIKSTPRKSWQAQKCSPRAHLRRTSASYTTARSATSALERRAEPVAQEVGGRSMSNFNERIHGRPDLARRWVRAFACSVVIVATAGHVQAQEVVLGSNLQGLLTFARAQSPELKAMRQEADAAAQRVGPAGALPDPVLRVELMNINNYGSDMSPSLLPWKVGETKYTLMQALPLWGKRDLKRDAASADARQADARADAAWAELAARIKATYAEYYRAAGNERLSTEVLGLMARLEQVSQTRYAGGIAGQSDAIRAQLEQTAMRAELIALDGEKRQIRARLNALLARDSAAPLAEPLALRPVPPVTTADAASLAERARTRNPLIQAELARVAAAQKNRDLTQRNRYPDLTIGVSPSQMGSRITTWGVMVEMNIPLQQDSRRSEEREAEAMVAAARSRTESLSQQLLGDLAVNLAGLEAARRTETLVKTQLLPQSELGLQSALAAYENGKAEFSMLLEAQRQIRKARQEILKSQVEAQMRLAEIERILGEDL
ncbi:TolC family protein [Roseateles sp.]|uniref:TolC family protein n=1 Tax=Roseateles sp. TaxID=1971397 RepID=UPI0039443B7C